VKSVGALAGAGAAARLLAVRLELLTANAGRIRRR